MTHSLVVHMKTGAGLAESSGKTNTLSPLDKSILARVDGKALPHEIARSLDLEPEHALLILSFLEQNGFIRPFITPASTPSQPQPQSFDPGRESPQAFENRAPESAPSRPEALESALRLAPEGSVDGLSLSARAQSNQRSSARAFQRPASSNPSFSPDSPQGFDPLPPCASLDLEPLGSFSDSQSPPSPHTPPAQDPARLAAERAQLAQQVERERMELQLEREQSERLAMALREAQQRSAQEAIEREKAERERSERLALALQEAQERARLETEARARAERELAAAEEQRLALEIAQREAQAREALALEIAAKDKAERDARDAAEREESERLAALERARKRRMGVFKTRARWALIASLAAAAAIAGASLTRLIRVTPASCSAELSSWLAIPADVGSCDVSLFPAPSVIATGILTKDGSIAVKRATLRLSIPSLAWGSKKIKSATLEDARLSAEGLMAAASARKLDPSQAGWLESVSFENATLSAGSFDIGGLSGTGKFLSNGSFDSARFYKESPAIAIESRLLKGVPTLSLDARLEPESAAGLLGFEEASLSGSLVSGGILLDELTLRHPAGLVQGRGQIQWSKTEWSAAGPFEARALQADRLAPWLFLDGRASLSGNYSASGPTAESLARNLAATASGKADSSIVKLDIANAMGFGQTGGVSRFSSIALEMAYANRSLSFSNASAKSGSLFAQWSASRSHSGSVSGSLQSSLSSLSGGPMAFSISGDDRKLSLSPKTPAARPAPAASSDE